MPKSVQHNKKTVPMRAGRKPRKKSAKRAMGSAKSAPGAANLANKQKAGMAKLDRYKKRKKK